MSMCVCMGAMLRCSFGTAPAPLAVSPTARVLGPLPFAGQQDNLPFVCIPPFGICHAPPFAASPVPVPCVPVTPAPWIDCAAGLFIGQFPALLMSSKLLCVHGGEITILSPGQVKTQSK